MSCNLKNGEQHILEWYIVLLRKQYTFGFEQQQSGERPTDGLQVHKDAGSTHFSVPEGHESHLGEPPGDGAPACHTCPCLWGLVVKTVPLSPAMIPSSVQERHLLRAAGPKKEGKSHLSPVKSPLNSLPKGTLRRMHTSNELGA